MKKTLFVFTVLFSVMVCTAANAGGKSPIYLFLPGILRPHSPLPPQPPPLPFVPFVPLNDTGITWGGSYPEGNNAGCTGEEIGAQDCSHGRDATHNDDSDGHAGFSFTKLDASGVPLANQAADYATTPWACVQDNVTGLIWEVKTNDGGLHDQHDSYTWYNTNPAANGGANGYDNSTGYTGEEYSHSADTCEGYVSGNSATYCNTQAYVARVNAAGWCGKSDWRMPTIKELEGIVFFQGSWSSFDEGYFRSDGWSDSQHVWSGSPNASVGGYSPWAICFTTGYGYLNHGSEPYGSNFVFQVLLVRSSQ